MKIALYGGTFDPIHKGHLEVARAAADALHLDRILFIPAGRPPHRAGRPEAPYRDRLAMVELACAADSRFEASELEAEREDGGPNYSIDTIRRVKAQFAAGDRLFFVIGYDAFADIRAWHRWQEVVREAEWIVVSRPEADCDEDMVPSGTKVHWLRNVSVPVSSTQVRRKLRARESVEQWLPEAVRRYVATEGLYSANRPVSITQVVSNGD